MKINAQSGEDDFDRIVEHMDSMIDEMMSRNFFRSSGPDTWQPAMNVYEADERFLVCIDLAGMVRDKIDVCTRDDVLHIRGDRPKPPIPDQTEPEQVSVHAMEIDSGRFHRKVRIPDDVDRDAIQASYRNGYLWITMPRRPSGGESPA